MSGFRNLAMRLAAALLMLAGLQTAGLAANYQLNDRVQAYVSGDWYDGTIVGFGDPTFFGTKGKIAYPKFNDEQIEYPGRELIQQHGGGQADLPHVTGQHIGLGEEHVYEDIMQLVDLVRDGTPTLATPEHARHVIDIIESAYRAAETGQTQELSTTFETLPVE